MTKYSVQEMKKTNYGRILLIASIAGKEVRDLGLCNSIEYNSCSNSMCSG